MPYCLRHHCRCLILFNFNFNFNLTSSFLSLSLPHTLPLHPFQHNILHDDMHSSILHETTVFSLLPPSLTSSGIL